MFQVLQAEKNRRGPSLPLIQSIQEAHQEYEASLSQLHTESLNSPDSRTYENKDPPIPASRSVPSEWRTQAQASDTNQDLSLLPSAIFPSSEQTLVRISNIKGPSTIDFKKDDDLGESSEEWTAKDVVELEFERQRQVYIKDGVRLEIEGSQKTDLEIPDWSLFPNSPASASQLGTDSSFISPGSDLPSETKSETIATDVVCAEPTDIHEDKSVKPFEKPYRHSQSLEGSTPAERKSSSIRMPRPKESTGFNQNNIDKPEPHRYSVGGKNVEKEQFNLLSFGKILCSLTQLH